MSFDIIILKPQRALTSLTEWKNTDVASPLGTAAEIRAACAPLFPGLEWSTEREGLFRSHEGHALEFRIPESARPESLHLSLHFGRSWSEPCGEAFHQLMARLYQELGWQAFAVSDNSAMYSGGSGA